MEKEKRVYSLTLHLSRNSCFISFNVQNMYHTISYSAQSKLIHLGWQEGGSFKRLCNLLEKFTRRKENPPKKSCSWCRKTLSHRLQEVLQKEVLLNTTLLPYFSPIAFASGFFHKTKHQATNYKPNSILSFLCSFCILESLIPMATGTSAAFQVYLLPKAGIWGFLHPWETISVADFCSSHL